MMNTGIWNVTLEHLANKHNIPYEILFKMLLGYEVGCFEGTDIFSRISCPYFGKTGIKVVINKKYKEKSSIRKCDVPLFERLLSQLNTREKENIKVLTKIARGDKSELINLKRTRLGLYVGKQFSVKGTVNCKKTEYFANNKRQLAICLTDVTDITTNDKLASHIWIFLKDHDVEKYYKYIYNDTVVAFTGTITSYVHNEVTKYNFDNIQNFRIVSITEKQENYIKRLTKEEQEFLYSKGLYKNYNFGNRIITTDEEDTEEEKPKVKRKYTKRSITIKEDTERFCLSDLL